MTLRMGWCRMCFSAPASFVAGFALVVVGTAIWKRGFKEEYRYLAFIPFVFALHQFIEGYVWLKQQEASLFVFFYLAIAFCFWPIWIPLSLLKLEKKEKTRQLDLVFLGMGVASATVLASLLPFFEITTCVNAIHYILMGEIYELNVFALGITYLIAVVSPFLFSSIKKLKVFGLFFLFSAFFSYYMSIYWYISLWCFFSALLSLFLLWVIPPNKHS